MSTWRMVRSSLTPGTRPLPAGHDRPRRIVPVDEVEEAAGLLPALGQPGTQRLADPGAAGGQVAVAGPRIDERRVHDDPVRVVDVELAGVVDRHVGLDPQVP